MTTAKLFKTIILCTAGCFGAILIMFAWRPRANENLNGFNRSVTHEVAKIEKVINIKYPAYYFAGNTEHHIYLGNYSAALHLLTVDNTLKDTISETMKLVNNMDSAVWKEARLEIDSPSIYITEGITKKFYTGKLGTRTLNKSVIKSAPFHTSIHLSGASYILKGIIGNENILMKLKRDSPYVEPFRNVLEKQIDGMFCTDGHMFFDRETSRLVYLYFYRNEFIVLDSNLNIQFRSRTIDTNSIAKIDVARVSSKKKRILSAPPTVVNRSMCIYKGRIYISCGLRADNESIKKYRENDIIDVYSLENGNYITSFYLPRYKGARAEQFRVLNGCIYAIYDRMLCMYSHHAVL